MISGVETLRLANVALWDLGWHCDFVCGERVLAFLRARADKGSGASTADDGPAHLLEIDGVDVRFGDRRALQNVTLSADAGEILVLLGPNGAGKSTLIKTICGRVRRAGGQVSLAGADPARSQSARRAIGIVPQQIALFEKLTARENLIAFGRLMGLPGRRARGQADQLLERVSLQDRAGDLVADLSGGMRRRINIAAALTHAPQLLILDEPTAGLDAAAKTGLVGLLRDLRNEGLSILLTTHDMDEADALADRVAILIDGRLRSIGTVPELVSQTFGERMEIKLILTQSAMRDPRAEPAVSALREARLTPADGGRTWTGFVEGGSRALGELLDVTAGGGLVAHVGVRQPGLDALLRVATLEAGDQASADGKEFQAGAA